MDRKNQRSLERILQIACTHLRCEIDYSEVAEESTLTEVFDLDSLRFMSLIAAIEESFEITFREDAGFEDLNSIKTLLRELNDATRIAANYTDPSDRKKKLL